MQTAPDGIMDIAKANSSKNRYLNIHTCKWGSAVLVWSTVQIHAAASIDIIFDLLSSTILYWLIDPL